MKSTLIWTAAIVLTLAIGAIAGAGAESATADQETADALHSRDWAARKVCNGRAFEWTDDKTLVCHREVKHEHESHTGAMASRQGIWRCCRRSPRSRHR